MLAANLLREIENNNKKVLPSCDLIALLSLADGVAPIRLFRIVHLPSARRKHVLVLLVPMPLHDFASVGLVLLNGRVRLHTHVFMDIEVEKGTGLASGLVQDEIVEREVVRQDQVCGLRECVRLRRNKPLRQRQVSIRSTTRPGHGRMERGGQQGEANDDAYLPSRTGYSQPTSRASL